MFICPPSTVYFPLPTFLGKVSLGRRDKGEMCLVSNAACGLRTHLAVKLAGHLKYQEWRMSLRVTRSVGEVVEK